jgi:RNA polymerase sigma-70 factor (ECF subfamily)
VIDTGASLGDTPEMAQLETTCWTVIQAAAAGSAGERDEFARHYDRVVRAYLAARWRGSACLGEIDDTVQEVFVECFKRGGVLQRVEPGRPGGFRAFLYGVVRNVALRVEASKARARERQSAEKVDLDAVGAEEDSLSRVFDRTWARALLREAGRRQEERARESGEEACRRVELLRLRFQEGLPIRVIAERWGQDAAALHHEYARARQEFKAALRAVVAFHHPGSPEQVEQSCAELLQMLG